jgi:hypothetical protein
MGLFDRLLGGNTSVNVTGAAKPAKKQQEEAFFLDADASSSMGNGEKELVEEVASMEMRREKATPGLGGVVEKQEEINLTGGIPKPVKKTFAEQMSKAELDQRMKGSAVGVNTPGQANPKLQAPTEAQPQIATQQQASKPGDISAFKGWVKDL